MKQEKYTDGQILTGIGNSDSDVLKYIYNTYYHSVRKFVLHNNGDNTDSEDLFQDCLIAIFNKVCKNQLVITTNFGSYLFAIAKTQWLFTLRTRKRANKLVQNLLVDEVDNFEILEELINAEKEKLIIQYFLEVSEECRKIFQLIFEGLSLEEITKQMGFASVQHTKNRRLLCKKQLIGKIINNPRFKELSNGTIKESDKIPRW